jgi:DNA (cytosine-5)-methyltransferase 1
MKIIEEKAAAIRQGRRRPQLLDLFSGCGGMTLGMVEAGAVSVGGVEFDPHAAGSYALNFHAEEDGRPSIRHAKARDIYAWEPKALLDDLAVDGKRAEVDIIIGGPPCPAYTRVGRAKLREQQDGDPIAHLKDARALYYQRYLHYVQDLKPVALLMENVPDILNFGGSNVGERICADLGKLGYVARYTLLNAVHYGVPQMRERFFLMAIHKSAGGEPSFPIPTHSADLPYGYKSSRHVALKIVETERAQGGSINWRDTPLHLVGTAAVTVGDALADLPAHVPGPRGARDLRSAALPYRESVEKNSYAHRMRTWRASKPGVTAHVTRALTSRDSEIFRRMKPGDEYPAALAIAEAQFAKALKTWSRKMGRDLNEGTPGWLELQKRHVPPYPAETFPNRWRKLDPDQPSRTLMAHLGKDTYSHIHYDNEQARVITVREAARLQSFPDSFVFCGSMNPAFRQIGNSVPPLLSVALGRELMRSIGVSIQSSEGLGLNAAKG